MINYQTLDTILSTTNRIPFNSGDLNMLKEYMKMSRSKGYDISLDPSLNRNTDAFQEALREGYIILKSETLDTCFVFINANAGTGFFGSQKRKILSFIGPPADFTFTAGPISNKFIVALTSINNIYRS